MAHFGLLSYKGSGHLNPLFALSRKLVARGHRVTVFQQPSMQERVRQSGLEFFPVDAVSSSRKRDRSACLIEDLLSRLRQVKEDMHHFLQSYPPAIQSAGVDALLIGEIALAGPTVAEMLRLPYFLISTTIPHNFGWAAPRSIRPRITWREWLQKELLEVSVLHMHGPIRRSLDEYRRQIGLRSIRTICDTFPELAHITQWPECLDILRRRLSKNFFYTGPFVDPPARPPVDFPWERLDGRPLVYMSLGTTLKGKPVLFERVWRACADLNLQIVVTYGGSRDAALLPRLPGGAIVVCDAPQLELLKRADIVVTHGGPNTSLETLLYGKPMLALPLVLDQPAVTAALVRAGAAEALAWTTCSTKNIRDALAKLCDRTKYRVAAQALQHQLRSRNSLEDASQIIEGQLRKFCGTSTSRNNDVQLTTA